MGVGRGGGGRGVEAMVSMRGRDGEGRRGLVDEGCVDKMVSYVIIDT